MSYSIIGIYSVVILTIGRFVRFQFSNLIVNIPYEDLHDVDVLMTLLQGVYLFRFCGDFLLEELLYRRVVKLFRTPMLLLWITRRNDGPKVDAVKKEQ